MTVRISWSGLRSHMECTQRTALARQGKRNKMADQRGFFPGTVTDRVVRDWLLNDPYDHLGEMPEMVEEIVNREKENIAEEGGAMRWKSPGDKEAVIAECQEAARRLEPILLERVVPFEYTPDIRLDVPVTFEDPIKDRKVNVLLVGVMDILTYRDGYYVDDVKHTKNNDYWRKTEGQLTFYDILINLKYGENTREVALLQPLCTDRVKTFKVSDDKRVQLLQRIENMAWDIVDNVAEPRKDSKVCYFCDVKHACPKYKGVMVNGKRRVSF